MKYSAPPASDATGKMGSNVVDEPSTAAGAKSHGMPSAEACFAGGERVGYDPKAHAIVAEGDAPSGFS